MDNFAEPPDGYTPPPTEENPLIDANRVVLMMKDPEGKMLPIPLPDLMNQIFQILRDHDSRIPEAQEESRIIRV